MDWLIYGVYRAKRKHDILMRQCMASTNYEYAKGIIISFYHGANRWPSILCRNSTIHIRRTSGKHVGNIVHLAKCCRIATASLITHPIPTLIYVSMCCVQQMTRICRRRALYLSTHAYSTRAIHTLRSFTPNLCCTHVRATYSAGHVLLL